LIAIPAPLPQPFSPPPRPFSSRPSTRFTFVHRPSRNKASAHHSRSRKGHLSAAFSTGLLFASRLSRERLLSGSLTVAHVVSTSIFPPSARTRLLCTPSSTVCAQSLQPVLLGVSHRFGYLAVAVAT
ncbi:hypothetical protein BOTBODRAFT_130838, partial [Botryobasidium botryosum FD-172 SS1]